MAHSNVDFTILLRRLQAADATALAELYSQTRMRLYAYAFSIVKDEQVAQDMVQELFVDFWEKASYKRVHTGLVGYLMQSVRHRCLDYVKREANRKRLRQSYFDESDQVDTNLAEARAIGQEIDAAIERLPPMAARVFRLHYLEQYSYVEIAERLGISTNTVSNHMTKALKRLREQLKKNT